MKISDKLEKIEETVSIQMYDNGFLFEVQGRNHEDEWSTVKILCNDLAEVSNLLTEATTLPRS